MTIKEAIKRQTTFVKKNKGYFDYEDIQAAQLGIEALKRIKDRRDLGTGWEITPLPGETES